MPTQQTPQPEETSYQPENQATPARARRPLRAARNVRTRGVKGAASWCALAAFVYLLVKLVLQAVVSFFMGLRVPGASLSAPAGFSQTTVTLLVFLIGAVSAATPVIWLLITTRLTPADLRIARPPQWSPLFCLVVFLGLANFGNIFGSLISRLLNTPGKATVLPAGGVDLFLAYLTLCALPAVAEEILFRGALQGLMRPCGSAAAILAPALLFALLHLDLAKCVTALLCGLFLGYLAERTGSILPGIALHLVNNTLAFADIYLQLYAPRGLAQGAELFVLLFFPVFGAWLVWRAVREQVFSFSDGMRAGVPVSAVFTSPAYTVGAVFLLLYGIVLTVAH